MSDSTYPAKDLLEKAEAAIARVREIHQPIDALNVAIGKVQQVCTGCGKDDGRGTDGTETSELINPVPIPEEEA